MVPPRLAAPVPGAQPEVLCIEQPFSNFQHVTNVYGGLTSVRRIFSQARVLGAQCLVVEEIPPTDLVEDENEEIRGLHADYRMKGLRRLSFWKTGGKRRVVSADDAETLRKELLKGQQQNGELLGVAVLKEDQSRSAGVTRWHVFEAVVRKPAREHNFVPGERVYQVRVGEGTHRIPGWLYCQQNGLNKGCAQEAIRSLLEEHRIPVLPYSHINGIAQLVRPSGCQGLRTDQVEAVLMGLHIGYSRDVFRPKAKGRPDLVFQQYLYAGVESG